MNKRNIIIHAHIFKNAGSSFDSSLLKNFKDAFIDHREDRELIIGKQEYLNNLLESKNNISSFSSHSLHFHPLSNDKFNFISIYFLRHPIERINSVYRFEKKQLNANTNGSKMAKELSYEEYLSWYMKDSSPSTIKNCQTIFLSGLGPSSNNIEGKFFYALKFINESDELFGIVDRYNESMVVFEEFLKKFFPKIDLSYIRQNITDKNINISISEKVSLFFDNLNPTLAEEILENNRYDIKLYEKANTKLDYRISKIDNFEEKLNDFNDRCELLKLNKFFNEGKFEKVIEAYDFNNKKIYMNLLYARSLISLGKLEDANNFLDNSIKVYSQNIWPYKYKIDVLKNLKKFEELHILTKYIRDKFPNDLKIILE